MKPATPVADAPARARARWKPWLRGGIAAVWLVMVGWLVVCEAYPHLFLARALPGYRALLGDVLVRDDWMRIDVLGRPAGYSHLSIDSGGNSPGAYTTCRHEMQMELNLMGRRQGIGTELNASLDAWQQLQHFTFHLEAGDYRLFANAHRTEGTRFLVDLRTPASRRQFEVAIPDDAVLSALTEEMAVRGLRPGQSVRLTTFDPATFSVLPVIVKALRRETIAVRGTNVSATVLASTVAGMQTLSWVDNEGRALRADSGIGWTFEACAPADALAALRAGKTVPQDDLLRRLAVTCRPPLATPVPRRLKLRLSGVPLTPAELASSRQQATNAPDGTLVLESRASAAPDAAATAAATRPAATCLAPTRTLQSDDPAILALARQITRDKHTPLAKAAAIHDWVQQNLRKEITLSLPTALDVLRMRQGDCNEHAVLSVALARAAGIPAVVKAGLVWHQDAFYYHAWPAFFAGGWIETDPTLGQPFADASHLAFVEGDIADQIAILKLIGRLRIELLEAE